MGTDDPHGSKGLLKWKGVTFAPAEEMNEKDDKRIDKESNNSTRRNHSEQDNEVFFTSTSMRVHDLHCGGNFFRRCSW